MQKFEYKAWVYRLKYKRLATEIDEEELNAKLNEFAKEGWEIIDTRPIETNETTWKMFFLFSKPLSK